MYFQQNPFTCTCTYMQFVLYLRIFHQVDGLSTNETDADKSAKKSKVSTRKEKKLERAHSYRFHYEDRESMSGATTRDDAVTDDRRGVDVDIKQDSVSTCSEHSSAAEMTYDTRAFVACCDVLYLFYLHHRPVTRKSS